MSAPIDVENLLELSRTLAANELDNGVLQDKLFEIRCEIADNQIDDEQEVVDIVKSTLSVFEIMPETMDMIITQLKASSEEELPQSSEPTLVGSRVLGKS